MKAPDRRSKKKKKTTSNTRVFYHQSFHGSVERIQKDAGNRAGLGCPVPAIRAVHQHTDAFISHCLRHREDRVILCLLAQIDAGVAACSEKDCL